MVARAWRVARSRRRSLCGRVVARLGTADRWRDMIASSAGWRHHLPVALLASSSAGQDEGSDLASFLRVAPFALRRLSRNLNNCGICPRTEWRVRYPRRVSLGVQRHTFHRSVCAQIARHRSACDGGVCVCLVWCKWLTGGYGNIT